MPSHETYHGGENFDLRSLLVRGRHQRLRERTKYFGSVVNDIRSNKEMLWRRCITSPADREVMVNDPYTGTLRRMLMFGSNNYLGLANHRYVREAAQRAIREYGIGIGGPPLLNGYTSLHRELEEKLAVMKGTEDAMIFSSGYGANVGLITGLVNTGDTVLYDAYSHASFCDGIKMSGVQSSRFPHNDIEQLSTLLLLHRSSSQKDVYVGVEGVYSMDGDLAPLDVYLPICKSNDAILIVDDAHGTGVMGSTGRGTAEHFGIEGQVDITMGTFSKTFAMTGGFIASSKSIIDYLRFFARSYMFSASLSPVVIATVLAGLDVIEHESELLVHLRENVQYAATCLQGIGFDVNPQAAIIPLLVPREMNIRQAAYKFHELGIFLNSIEYPAVPLSQQRFRISIMAIHTKEDIDRLVEAVDAVWNSCLDSELITQSI